MAERQGMVHRIFVAGASGAVGRRLVPLLRGAGHQVAGTTRSAAKAAALRALGAEPVVVDVFDAAALSRAVRDVAPDIVIHQLTDLPPGLDPALMPEAVIRNAHLREVGTAHLVEAALSAKARRLIAQSIAWVYAPGPRPHEESAPLDAASRGVVTLERHVLHSPPLEGVVLRYGQLYGPGTGRADPAGAMPVHVDAAAYAAFLAVDRGAPGAFNIAEPNGDVATEKAQTELGWRAEFRAA